MANEFTASIPDGSVLSLPELAERLTVEGLCCVELLEDNAIRLRWSNQPRRNDWPEDITLSLDSEKLILSIHSGTGDQRASLIRNIESHLSASQGQPVVFDEA